MVPGLVRNYRVTEWVGTSVEGQFYAQDLQKVSVPDDGLSRVEKVMQCRVRWMGWPAKYYRWTDNNREWFFYLECYVERRNTGPCPEAFGLSDV